MPNGGRIECRIYIGNLPPHVRTKDLEDIFFKYGPIAFIDIKNNDRGTPFAFIEYEDARDADDAVQSRDGYNFDGYRLRVEYCRGGRGASRYAGFKDDQRYRNRRSGPPSRRSQYRVTVTDLPPSGSWQDLKDHMREAGDVCYADVYKDGTGVVEFLRFDDMKYAVRKLNDTKFRSHEGEVSYIHVRADPKFDRRLSRSRSFSYGGRRMTPGYSPLRNSRSRS